MTKFYLGINETIADIYFGVVVSLVSMRVVSDFWRAPSWHSARYLCWCPSRGYHRKGWCLSAIAKKTSLDFCLLFTFLMMSDSNFSPNKNWVSLTNIPFFKELLRFHGISCSSFWALDPATLQAFGLNLLELQVVGLPLVRNKNYWLFLLWFKPWIKVP